MSKKIKFELTRDLITRNKELESEELESEELESEEPSTQSAVVPTKKEPVAQIVIRVPTSFKNELKVWCAKNNISITQALIDGINIMKKKY